MLATKNDRERQMIQAEYKELIEPEIEVAINPKNAGARAAKAKIRAQMLLRDRAERKKEE